MVHGKLESGEFDIFHFAGHASQSGIGVDYSTLELEPEVDEAPGMEKQVRYPQCLETIDVENLKHKWLGAAR